MEEQLTSTGEFRINVEEALKTGFYVSGAPGSGKTNLAMYCSDALLEQDVNVLIWDPSQAWLDKYRKINRIIKFVNPPFNFDNFKLSSAILDTSTLTVLQMQEVVDYFCQLLFNFQAKKNKDERRPYFLLFEEAQIIAPQGAMRAKRLQNVMRVVTVGRNYKLRIGLITQFASTVDKDVIKSTQQRWFGWSNEPNDIRYIGKIVGDDKAASLASYKTGDFLYHLPSQSILEKIHCEAYV